MQAISDIIDAQLQSCFPFLENFYGFTSDLTIRKKATMEQAKKKQKGEIMTFPIGCNKDVNECSEDELQYVLPESEKQSIVFYDKIKIVNSQLDLECGVTEVNYNFDIVVWINTKKIQFTNVEFCNNNELMYNHFIKCLQGLDSTPLTVLGFGLYSQYYRSPWKFTDCIKYLNQPYIAFRMPITVRYSMCPKDLPDLTYTETPDC